MVLVILVCVAIICESAAVFDHERFIRPPHADDDVRRWRPGRPGRAKNSRFIIPSIKHRANEQKRKQTVSEKKVNGISNKFKSKLAAVVNVNFDKTRYTRMRKEAKCETHAISLFAEPSSALQLWWQLHGAYEL